APSTRTVRPWRPARPVRADRSDGRDRPGVPRRSGGALAAGIVLAVVLIASLLAAILIGPAEITPSEVWRVLATHLRLDVIGVEVEPLSRLRDGMVWHLRAPRALTAAAVG